MLKKIYNIVLIISFPLIYIHKIFSKFFYIKYGEADAFRVGHLVGETSLWYLEKKDGNPSEADLEIWYVSKNVCNYFFYKKMKSKIIITHNFIIKFLHDLFRKFNKKEFIIMPPQYGERDVRSLISKNKKIIEFTDEEIKYGDSFLKKIGINKNENFVCIAIRDSYYLNKVLPTHNWTYHNFKNSDIENYNKAVKYLNDINIKVIRMGAGSDKSWSLESDKNFDYSRSNLRTSFLDFYIVHKSKFVLCNGTGFYWIPYVLKKPIVMADFIPIASLCSYVPHSLHLFKHLYSNDKKRFLSLKELLSEEFNFVYGTDSYTKKNIKIVDNSPDEIVDCVKEMNLKIDGELQESEEDQINQKKFWVNLPSFIKKKKKTEQRNGIINAKIGRNFLKKYASNFN